MPDVIIALVPAVGHEALVADGPRVPGCEPERPMLLRRCSCGSWLCPALDGALVGGVHHPEPGARDVALVLYAPGGVRLGPLRVMAALDVDREPHDGEADFWIGTEELLEGERWAKGDPLEPVRWSATAMNNWG